MALGEIQISALPQATLPVSFNDIFHLKQGIVDKRCTLEQLLFPHTSLKNNPHETDKIQVGLGLVENALQLVASKNLADLPDKALARANLGVLDKTDVESLFSVHTQNFNNPHKTTKHHVELGNVNNWTVSNLYNEDANKYASAKAVNALYEAIKAQYPVGSLHISMNPANPSTYLLCGGVWTQEASGKALVGFENSSRPVGTSFGNSSVTLSTSHLPSHSHSVTLSGGNHSHSASTQVTTFDHGIKSTSTFDYGSKTSSTFDHGTKTTSTFDYGSRSTNQSGGHTHGRGSMEITGGIPMDWGTMTSVYFAPTGAFGKGARNRLWDAQRLDYSYGYEADFKASRTWSGETSESGAHSHTLSIGAHSHTVAIGSHNHSIAIGSHSHTVAIGSHGHTATTSVGESSHTHSGNTNATGSGQSFSIESPSLVVYVWRRIS